MNNKGKIAISQIIILILGIIAIAFVIESSFGKVEATGGFTSPLVGESKSIGFQGSFSSITTSTQAVGNTGNGASWFSNAFSNTKSWVTQHAFASVLIGAAILAGIAWAVSGDVRDALAVGKATTIGFGTGSAVKFVLSKFGAKWAVTAGWFAGGAVAIIFLLTYKKEKQEIVTFTCYPWDAPTGGNKCEECNNQGDLPCSEYQCRSLGQSCELINPGTSEELCAWVNRNDIEYPIITPSEEALLDGYKYTPDNAVSPPDRGVKIVNSTTNGCVKAFTPLSFGIDLNEPAKCKLDVLRKESYENMTLFFSGSLSKYNHSFTLSLPGSNALEAENITIKNNGNYEIYVRCEDSNKNSNPANFVFKYCVEEGPDTTPPLIVSTSILNNMPIKYEQNSIDLEVYINEPADCRWSYEDQDYENMEEEMSCAKSVFDTSPQTLYRCKTTLNNLQDYVENEFYFRCKDQPIGIEEGDRNTNSESYKFTLIGTQPLVIDEVLPNETVRDSSEEVKVTLKVKTSAGYDEGNSTCYYSDENEEKSYNKFFNTDSYAHSQDLYLPEGEYTYYIKCVDLGGNEDREEITFNTESDNEAPIVVRAYYEENYLVIVTNEDAECVYSTNDCNYLFDDGTSMINKDSLKHYVTWNTQTELFIKCKDEYLNQPNPDECNIIIRGYED